MIKRLVSPLLLSLCFSLLSAGCKCNSKTMIESIQSNSSNSSEGQSSMPHRPPMMGGGTTQALAPITIYMTKADYSNLVPIGLSSDKGSVVSYPAPSDLRRGNGYTTPIPLAQGYWFDRRGVGLNTAFTSLTYEEYAALEVAPKPDELLKMLVDSDPFIELIHCDRSYFDVVDVKTLNAYIQEGLPEAKRLKK